MSDHVDQVDQVDMDNMRTWLAAEGYEPGGSDEEVLDAMDRVYPGGAAGYEPNEYGRVGGYGDAAPDTGGSSMPFMQWAT